MPATSARTLHRIVATIAIAAMQLGLLLPSASAQSAAFSADIAPYTLGEGYTTPQEMLVDRWDEGAFHPGTQVTIHDYDWETGAPGAERSGAVDTVVVDDITTSHLTFDLVAELPVGSYYVVFESGGEIGEGWFEVVAPEAYLDPQELPEGFAPGQTITANGWNTIWDSTTTVTIHPYDWETEHIGGAISGAAGNESDLSETELTFDLLLSLDAGDYIARITTGAQQVDASLWIAAPWASVDPDFLGTGYAPGVAMTMTGTWTLWTEAPTTVTIHDWDWEAEMEGPARPGAVSDLDVTDNELLAFSLDVSLPEGNYIARATTDGRSVDAMFDVTPPSMGIDPYVVDINAEVPVDFTAWGILTGWDETTSLSLHEYNSETGVVGDEFPNALEVTDVPAPDEMAFRLTQMPPQGEWMVRATTGAQQVESSLTATVPSGWLWPDRFGEGYPTQPVEANGWLTLWSETNTPLVSIHPWDAATETPGDPIDGQASLEEVHGRTWLDFTLEAGLAQGDYIARFTSGTEVADARFEVLPAIEVHPEYVENNSGEPVWFEIWNNRGDLDPSTATTLTMEVLDSSGVLVEDVTSSVNAWSQWFVDFELSEMPENGIYTVRMTVDGVILEETFEVGDPLPWVWLSPDRLPTGFDTPQEMSVFGELTTFEAGVTTVDINDVEGDPMDGFVANVDVSSGTELTFDLMDPLPDGGYEVVVTTDGEVARGWFDVGPYAFAEPGRLEAGYASPATIELIGAGTVWDGGTTVTMFDDFGDPVDEALYTVSWTGAASISVILDGPLAAGFYSFEIVTGDQILIAWFDVFEPMASIDIVPDVLASGYPAPTTIGVIGHATHFDLAPPEVKLFDLQTETYRPTDVGTVNVSGPTSLEFQLLDTLPDGYYNVEVITPLEHVSALLAIEVPPRPSAWLEPSWVFEGYGSQPMTAHGEHTHFDAGSLVTVHEDDGTLIDEVASGVNAETMTELSFTLGGNLEPGSYIVRVSTGDEIVESWFWVAQPWGWLDHGTLDVGYSEKLQTATGWGTAWHDDLTSIEILDEAGALVRTIAAGAVDVENPESLTFTLDAGLDGGSYTVRTKTAGSSDVDLFLSIVEPSIRIQPAGLETGYTTPKRVDVWGTATDFSSSSTGAVAPTVDVSTTVQILEGGIPLEAQPVDALVVDFPWHLSFNLSQSLPAGTYTVRVTTGDQVVDAPLVVATPKAQMSSTSGSTTVKADGTVTVNVPTGNKSDVVVEREPACPGAQTLSAATVQHNGKSYPMSRVAAGSSTWRATIPAADLAPVGSSATAKAITMTVTCNGDVSDPEGLGEIVLYDPSGIVSDADTEQPIVGATVTLFKVPGWMPRQFPGDTNANTCESNVSKAPEDPWSQDAPTHLGVQVPATSLEIDPQQNPQTTNSIGYYGWDVAQGCWYVTVSATGYEPLVSPVVGVPPEVTDLDLELTRLPDETAPTWNGEAAVTTSEVGETSVKLSWPAAADNVGVNQYRIYQIGDAVRPAADTLATTLPATARSKTLTGLTANRSYTFRVVPVDAAGNEGAGIQTLVSTPDGTAPTWGGAAALTRSNVSASGVRLSWPAAADNDAVKGYRLFQDGVQIANVTTRSRTVTGLAPETVYTFKVEAYDHKGNESTTGPSRDVTTLAVVDPGEPGEPGEPGVPGEPGEPGEPAEPGAVTRQSGENRFETAVAISKASFGAGVPVVYIAFSHNFPDALAGGPAAAKNGGPILLVETNVIPEVTRQELARLLPGTIVILGGQSAVSLDVERELAGFTPGRVSRIAGSDRYETAASISKANYQPGVPVVYVATGEKFPDALAGGAAAVRDGGPVLLVKSNEIPASTATELARLTPGRIVVLGGESAVSASVASQLTAYTIGAVDRLWGTGRYETAAAILGTFEAGVDTVYVATGGNFPDALAGVPAAGLAGAPIVLLPGDSIPDVIATELRRLTPRNIVVLGGETVIGPLVMMSLGGYLAG